MTLFKKMIIAMRTTSILGPVFIKEESDAPRQLEHLKSILELSTGETRTQIENDIKLLNQGIIGEDNIAFELKNSHMPMLILHDLNLEFHGLTAQIDYVIITKFAVVIVECKNLYGNIEINTNGDFIRTLEFNGRYRKEGIYSPITQNQRHFELIKQARLELSNGAFDRMIKSSVLSGLFRTVVVLANPKTLINMKHAKKEIKDKIIRADQLITYLKNVNNENSDLHRSDEQMFSMADFLFQLHKDTPKDYTGKYKLDLKPIVNINPKTDPITEPVIEPLKVIPIEETAIYKVLREYRLLKSREKELKAFQVFSNAHLEDLCKHKPSSLDELIKISGFDQKRIKEYGEDIIRIIKDQSIQN
jgi:protein required for attachment to host cells